MKSKKKAIIVLMLFIIMAIFSDKIAPYSTDDFSFEVLLKPSYEHILGTDEMGHDLFSLVMNGFRVTISIALISAIFSTLIGSLLALISTVMGGIVDKILVRICDVFIMIPEIIIILFFAAFAKPSLLNTLYAIIFFSWGKVFRILRAKILAVKEKSKVKYTLLMKGNVIDISKKLWYDIRGTVVTMFILQCSKAAVYETTLSYFGIGDPIVKTWGKVIKSAMNFEGIFYDGVYMWYLIPPILCLIVFIVSLAFLTFDKME